MPRLEPKVAPPPDYYSNNLLSVVEHVLGHHGELLGGCLAKVARIPKLSSPGLRLLARLLSRTTPVIRLDSLNYPEIADSAAALAELAREELVAVDGAVAAEQLLERLKVAELKALFPQHVTPKQRKAELIECILLGHTDAAIRRHCASQFSWVTLRELQPPLQRLLLAYFGDLYRDLTEFVVRDLGISEFEPYPLGDNARAFADSNEMDSYLELSALQALPKARRGRALDWLLDRVRSHDPQRSIANPTLRRRQDRLLNAWGRDFERSDNRMLAHQCYAQSETHPARERQVRMLHKVGDEAARDELLGSMAAAPWSFEEALFARRFNQPRRGVAERWVETCWAAIAPKMPGVERYTGRRLTDNGGQAWHTENALLTSLLGLAFWDILFADEPGMFTHPFQAGPRDLFWPDFRTRSRRREAAIEQRLTECRDGERLWSRIFTNAREKAPRQCRLVHWGLVNHAEQAILRAACNSFSARQLAGLFDYMLRDLGAVRSGMPDLFVSYGPGQFELVEVKGPSDQLQPNQRVWLDALVELGIPCRVIKHRYQGSRR